MHRDFSTLAAQVNHWREHGGAGPVKTRRPLGLDLNVQLTLQVLEQAAAEGAKGAISAVLRV